MAKAKKQVGFEDALWGACDKLRGTVEPAEYKHVVLSLIFLKFINDKFDARREELISEGKEKYLDKQPFYTMKNVFFVPEESRWSFIIQNAKQNDIALKIDTALNTIEKQNPSLKGALPDNYYSRLGIDVSKLAALLDEINNIQTNEDKENDIMGRVYEYFLTKFALQEGKGKGEFYTPKSVVNLIAEMIEPYKGKIYDPCCGSGGMFVQSLKFVENHAGNSKDVSVYGQEGTTTTYKLAKMNLAIRGIPCDLGEKAANTFTNDLHKDLRADYIMANPPFNQKAWRAENELVNDARWHGYSVPPTSNANYGWILHIVSKLSTNGTAGFLLANGALSGEGQELEIRRQLIENNLVEAIVILPRNLFYTTDISVTLWILNKNKKSRTVEQNKKIKNYRNREEEVLFMDLRQMGSPFEKKYIELTQEDRDKVTQVFHTWQQVGANKKYKNIPEFCYSATKREIAEKGYNLVPSRYIEFVNRDETQDYDSAMKALQSELTELLKQEEMSKKELLGVFKDLGYEIKL
ncbi:MAG: SAM-dependent DNA methyltransferase [Spirochaetaceae bacterium]|nr:SAM-dependent DNA methyltransferase [Spirochaetaceae bacterium]